MRKITKQEVRMRTYTVRMDDDLARYVRKVGKGYFGPGAREIFEEHRRGFKERRRGTPDRRKKAGGKR